jgi:CDP-alcohol phosphatidyltransferase 2
MAATKLARNPAADRQHAIQTEADAARCRDFAAPLVANPWAALAASSLIYVGMLPFSVRSCRRLQREAEGMHQVEEP